MKNSTPRSRTTSTGRKLAFLSRIVLAGIMAIGVIAASGCGKNSRRPARTGQGRTKPAATPATLGSAAPAGSVASTARQPGGPVETTTRPATSGKSAAPVKIDLMTLDILTEIRDAWDRPAPKPNSNGIEG